MSGGFEAPGPGAAVVDPSRASLAGELLDPTSLSYQASEVAARQRAANTRRAYASTYRAFAAFLGPGARLEDLTAEAVRRYRDELERSARSRATIARQLSALRGLADELGADPAVQRVRADRVPRHEPRALSLEEYDGLLAVPDRRTTRGRRDLAILYVLGDAGLRRSELCALRFDDLERVRRLPEGGLRRATARRAADVTEYVLHVRAAKRGRSRSIPLNRHALRALIDWRDARPACASDRVFVSLPVVGGQRPGDLSTRAVADIVAGHAARARLPEDMRTPHVLRHTFCTVLADRGVGLERIALLAGHADIRTTQGYVTVAGESLHEAAVETFERGRSGLARAV